MADPPVAGTDGDDNHVASEPGSGPGTPRWVKVFGIIAIILTVAIVIGFLTGQLGPGADHGPGRHTGSASGPTSPSAIQQDTGAVSARATAEGAVIRGAWFRT